MFVHEMINGADPAHIALDGDVEITYGQLAETIRRFRNLLYREGVRKGDRCRIVRIGDLRKRKKRPHFVENQISKSLKELFK